MASSIFGGSKTISSPNVKVVINNRVAGFVTNATWSIDYSTKPIYEIDRIVPREIMPGAYMVKFNLTGVRILKTTFEDMRIVANPGLNYLLPYISLSIMDRVTNDPLLNIRSAMIDSLQNTVSSKGIMTFNMSGTGFTALNASDLVDPVYSGSPPTMIQR